MKKFSLIALMSIVALMSAGAYAREATFEEALGGDSGSVIRGLNAEEAIGAQKIAFPVPAGMESCKYASVQGDTCSFICKSGATVTRPRLNSSVAQNGGCALFVMVPAQAKAVKAAFDGPQVTRVENADYVCQANGGGYAIAAGGKAPRIWQLDGEASGAKEGMELSNVSVTRKGQAGRLEAAGALSFFGQTLKVNLSLNPDPRNGGKPSMTAKLDGEAVLKDVPCKVFNGSAAVNKAAAYGPRVYAEGHLYAYNKASKQYDTDMFLRCSVTLENFKSYLDTQHGSPRDVVSADYRLGGFPDLGGYASGNGVALAPDQYSNYVNLQGYDATGLTKGVDVNIFIDKVASAQAFVAGPAAPLDVYVTMEKSMTSYFGGDGVKWGYWCDFRRK